MPTATRWLARIDTGAGVVEQCFLIQECREVNILFILNDPPYGTERSFNGLRLAKALLDKDNDVTVFLMADAVACAKKGQKVPNGYYSIERMLKPVVRSGELLLCGTCMDARGIADDEVLEGARRSSMDELAGKTIAADRLLVF